MAANTTGVKFDMLRVNSIGIDCDYSQSKPFLSRENSQNIENEIKAENNKTAGKSNHARAKVDFKRSISQGASPSSGRLGKLNVNGVPLLRQQSRLSSPDTILNIELRDNMIQNDLKKQKPGHSETCWKYLNILSLLSSLACIALVIFFIINKEAFLVDANNSLIQSSENDFRHSHGTASAQQHFYEGSNSVQFRMNQNASNKMKKVVWENANGDENQFEIDGECVTIPEDGTYIGFATLTFKYTIATEFSDFLSISVGVRPRLSDEESMLLMTSELIPPKHLRENRRVLKPLQINFTQSLKAGDKVCIRSNRLWSLHYPGPLNNFFTLAKL